MLPCRSFSAHIPAQRSGENALRPCPVHLVVRTAGLPRGQSFIWHDDVSSSNTTSPSESSPVTGAVDASSSTFMDSISKREGTGRVALDLSDLGIEMPRTRRLDSGRLRMRRQGGYAPTA